MTAIDFPEQRNDYSYGLDSTGLWQYFQTPTPGAANGYQEAAERIWRKPHLLIRAIYRDTTLSASEGCLFGDPTTTGACGLTGQLLIRIEPAATGAAECSRYTRFVR